jgi:hypothetical protein
LFEIVPALMPRDCFAFIAGQQVYQRHAQLLPNLLPFSTGVAPRLSQRS